MKPNTPPARGTKATTSGLVQAGDKVPLGPSGFADPEPTNDDDTPTDFLIGLRKFRGPSDEDERKLSFDCPRYLLQLVEVLHDRHGKPRDPIIAFCLEHGLERRSV